MIEGYFKRFCSNLDKSEECQLWAEETESGNRTQESLYELLLEKYGEEAVAQAHINAMSELDKGTTREQQPRQTITKTSKERDTTIQEGREPTPTIPPETIKPRPLQKQVTKEAIIEKAKELQRGEETKRREGEAQRRAAENERREREGLSTPRAPPPPPQKGGHMPAAPSGLKDICRVCVTPPTIAILEVLKLWYGGDDAKFIEDIVDKVGNEDILLEEALARIFVKDPNSLDGIERTLQDFNSILAEALQIAARKSPELKARFDQEKAELESGPLDTDSETEGSG